MGAAIVAADAVVGTSTTAGTGTLQLGPAVAGYREWAAAGIATGARVPYEIREGTTFEIGLGTLTSGTPWTLSRDTVDASSAGGARVNWGSGGTRTVALTVPATAVVLRDDDGMITVPATPTEDTHAAPRAFAAAQPVAKTRMLRGEAINPTTPIPFGSAQGYAPVTLPTGARRIAVSGALELDNAAAQNRIIMTAVVRDAADTTTLGSCPVGWLPCRTGQEGGGLGGALELAATPLGAFIRIQLERQANIGPVTVLTLTYGITAVTD
jgi:hypothetical protein